MPCRDLQDYRWRGARALVLIHEQSMREFLPVWREAVRWGVRLPTTDDPDYASFPTLLHHVFRASRGYMTWLCEKLELPDPRIEPAPPAEVVERDADRYLEHLLERWRTSLAGVDEARLQPIFKTRWGADISGESMLEHAVVHPLRHRFQLEELMERASP
ncbi:MAG: hypothetical protein HY825_04730 [Acidobacteria bacterium]|nr:hypothetical protein [Acidobacteriota bacterium]